MTMKSMSKNNAIGAAAEMSKQPATAQVFIYLCDLYDSYSPSFVSSTMTR